MAIITEITHEILKQVISYNPDSGDCYFLSAKAEWFEDKPNRTASHKAALWNARFSGKKVGNISTSTGYYVAKIFGNQKELHRFIWFYMTGEWPEQIDHINGIRTDNRWHNLRNVSQFVNMKNTSLCTKNKSGRIGVIENKKNNTWIAQIQVNGKGIYLGTFHIFEDACAAREDAERKYGFHPNHGRVKNESR